MTYLCPLDGVQYNALKGVILNVWLQVVLNPYSAQKIHFYIAYVCPQ